MISHSKKFIFVHVPRTGGTSMHYVLKEYCHDFKNHEPLRLIDPKLISAKYFIFCIVRNPWDLVVSRYKYGQHKATTLRPFEDWLKKSYENYLAWRDNPKIRAQVEDMFCGPFWNQIDWIKDSKNKITVDFIGRFENLQHDFNHILKKIGVTNRTLPHLNKSTNKQEDTNTQEGYRSYYNDDLRNIVFDWFRDDIMYFGYEF